MSEPKPIFRTSQDEVWKKLSEEISGQFVPGKTRKGGKCVAKTDDWTVTLDTHRVDTQHDHIVYTRLRAPYVNKDGFNFLIYRQSFFASIEKMFGLQDIEIGDPDFDNKYIIQGNNVEKVKKLFSNPKIRTIIQTEPTFYGEIRPDDGWFHDEFPDGVDELYCLVEDEITNLDELKSLFELFAEILNTLCHIGSAYECDPQIEL